MPNTKQESRREIAERIVRDFAGYANPIEAIDAILKERYEAADRPYSTLAPEELAEIRQRRARMIFPDGRPTGAWLDIDRLLAHETALRLAVNVRDQAIRKQLGRVGESETAERPLWAVSVVMVRETSAAINTQNRLLVIEAANRDAAHGRALALTQEEFPEHHLHTICCVAIRNGEPHAKD